VQWDQVGADASRAVIEEACEPVGQSAAGAEPTSVQLTFLTAAGAGVGRAKARALDADRGAVGGSKAWKDPLLAAARAAAVVAQSLELTGPADRPIRPDGGEAAEPPATGAGSFVPPHELLGRAVGGVHSSDRIRAALRRSVVTVDDGTGRSSVAVLRTPAFSAVVVTKSAGVQLSCLVDVEAVSLA
jgi:hypothetical protein